ncbi:MAG: LacI family DNA-binding transcriptional regulator [Kiritimatiellae bacterium]|nr:LacI family DNA-binding transcriptional regulator [Kiritimatiellia bacterium]
MKKSAKKRSRPETPGKVSEIAERFGLSRVTVSYILNDRWAARGISRATAEKVLDYVREVGFRPNLLGLALRGKTVKEIAVLIPARPVDHHKNAFFSLVERLEQTRKTYIVLPFGNDNMADTVQFLKIYRVEKLIVFSAGINKDNLGSWVRFFGSVPRAACMLYDFPFPAVNPDALLLSGKSAVVGFDRARARKQALDFMIAAGYKRLILPKGFFETIPEKYYPRGGIRAEFYELASDGLTPLFKRGELAAERLLSFARHGLPKAVYVNDDRVAAGMIHRLREKGVRVPGQLAFISWDGLPESLYFEVPLTAVVVPHEAMLARVFAWLEGREKPRLTRISTRIREEASLPAIARSG